MNGIAASKLVGITYRQLGYFVERIDAFPKKETSQGHDHDFSFRDLVYLKLAAVMRTDGIRLDDINDAINGLIDRGINIEDYFNAGTLVYTGSERMRWIWTRSRIFSTNSQSYLSIPKVYYSVGQISQWLSGIL